MRKTEFLSILYHYPEEVSCSPNWITKPRQVVVQPSLCSYLEMMAESWHPDWSLALRSDVSTPPSSSSSSTSSSHPGRHSGHRQSAQPQCTHERLCFFLSFKTKEKRGNTSNFLFRQTPRSVLWLIFHNALTHSSSSTPSKESCGSGSSMLPSLATMALSSWEAQHGQLTWMHHNTHNPVYSYVATVLCFIIS